jgi:nickel transport protein
MPKIVTTALLALILTTATSFEASAHKVVAGAFASGDRIEGEIGFSDGAMAKNVLVEVFDEAGAKLGETRTGDDGTFVFVPTRAVTHVFRADLGAGHTTGVRVEKADLPASLAAAGPAETAAASPGPAASEPAAATPVAAPATAATSEALRAAIVEAVRNEVKPLRREIIALKEKNDFQSILGGLGYIVGLFGLWFFLAARSRQKRPVG